MPVHEARSSYARARWGSKPEIFRPVPAKQHFRNWCPIRIATKRL